MRDVACAPSDPDASDTDDRAARRLTINWKGQSPAAQWPAKRRVLFGLLNGAAVPVGTQIWRLRLASLRRVRGIATGRAELTAPDGRCRTATLLLRGQASPDDIAVAVVKQVRVWLVNSGEEHDVLDIQVDATDAREGG